MSRLFVSKDYSHAEFKIKLKMNQLVKIARAFSAQYNEFVVSQFIKSFFLYGGIM